MTLVDNTKVHYKVKGLRDIKSERAIKWDDPNIAINWPILENNIDKITLSDKDEIAPNFDYVIKSELFYLKVLLTGYSGQLGKALIYSKPKNIGLICPTRKELDLADFDSCFNIVIKNKPDWIINAGAFTNVDQAEINRELTLAVNSKCLVAFCKALKITGGKLMQISTDYVFDGEEKKPYKVNQKKSPINFYGYSKHLRKIIS